ncbi:MAG: hypothetical protein R2991_16915 [Thermoanaerobaculia bacterium]
MGSSKRPRSSDRPGPTLTFEAAGRAEELLALLPAPAGAGLPRWAQVHRGLGRRPSMPGEKLYDLLGSTDLAAGAGAPGGR